MDDFNPQVRLRNACDACHKLKRRCTGTMPCSNCTTLSTFCMYSTAGRLGRPPGSKNRRNAKPIEPRRVRKPQSPVHERSEHASPKNTHSPPIDILNDVLANELAMDLVPNSDTVYGWLSSSKTHGPQGLDTFDTLDYPALSHDGHSIGSSLSTPSLHLDTDQQHQLQHHHHHPADHALTQWAPSSRQRPYPTPLQPQPSRPSSDSSPSSSCNCLPGFSALLHDLKRPGTPRLDTVLTHISILLTQISALAACPRCQSGSSSGSETDHPVAEDDDDSETLLLAALSTRRTLAQLRAVMQQPQPQPPSQNSNASAITSAAGPPPPVPPSTGRSDDVDHHHHPQTRHDATTTPMYVGAFAVTGADRALLLGVLRTVNLRRLEAAVEVMRGMLRHRRAAEGSRRGGDGGAAAEVRGGPMLSHIGCVLEEAAEGVQGLLEG